MIWLHSALQPNWICLIIDDNNFDKYWTTLTSIELNGISTEIKLIDLNNDTFVFWRAAFAGKIERLS